MTRTALSYQVADLSALARHLGQSLAEQPSPPGHLALMNMLARGAGFRNFQHFRASQTAEGKLAAPPAPQADFVKVSQVLRHFDDQGRLTRWPGRTWQQYLCLWALWSRLPAETDLTERQISALLNQWHLFGDAAILRRTMAELGLVSRSPGVSIYRRTEAAPSPEARAVIRHLHAGV